MVNNVGTRSAVCCLRYFEGIARYRRWRHKLREGRPNIIYYIYIAREVFELYAFILTLSFIKSQNLTPLVREQITTEEKT
jgi:hypothetical protein